MFGFRLPPLAVLSAMCPKSPKSLSAFGSLSYSPALLCGASAFLQPFRWKRLPTLAQLNTPPVLVALSGFHPGSASISSIISNRLLCSLCALGFRRANPCSYTSAAGSCLRNVPYFFYFISSCLKVTLRCTTCSGVTMLRRRLPHGKVLSMAHRACAMFSGHFCVFKNGTESLCPLNTFRASKTPLLTRLAEAPLRPCLDSQQKIILLSLGLISFPMLPSGQLLSFLSGIFSIVVCCSGLSWYLAWFRVLVKPCSIVLWISGYTNFARSVSVGRQRSSGSQALETGPKLDRPLGTDGLSPLVKKRVRVQCYPNPARPSLQR